MNSFRVWDSREDIEQYTREGGVVSLLFFF